MQRDEPPESCRWRDLEGVAEQGEHRLGEQTEAREREEVPRDGVRKQIARKLRRALVLAHGRRQGEAEPFLGGDGRSDERGAAISDKGDRVIAVREEHPRPHRARQDHLRVDGMACSWRLPVADGSSGYAGPCRRA